MIFKKSSYFFVFLLILAAASILRFWRLDALTTVSGDQGFDFQAVRSMVVEKNITLLGPKIGPYNEIGNLYLGPFYYYLLAPALFFSGFDPIGAAVLTVILALLTILLIYVISREYFSLEAALTASMIYAFNPLLINQSRAASNPHLIPFFAAIFIWTSLKTLLSSKSIIWPIVCGLVLGLGFQLHYLAIALAPVFILMLVISREGKKLLAFIGAFIVAISPQIVFELRHDFFVTRLFMKQLTQGDNIFSLGLLFNHLRESDELLSQIFTGTLPVVLFGILTLLFIYYSGKRKATFDKQTLILLGIVASGILAASLYAGSISVHYFAAIYVPLVILIGVALAFLLRSNLVTSAFGLALLVFIIGNYLTGLNLNSPNGYTMPLGWNLLGIRKASAIIAKDAGEGEKFNIAQTIDGDTRAMPLRYMAGVYGRKALDVEHYPDAEAIYLLSRDKEEEIYKYNVWEISSFRPFKIESKWEIQNGIYLYLLRHPG